MSAYFSAAETAFSSLNKIRLKNLANNGNKKAILAQKLAENYDKLISSILIGNNIVNILSASLATALFVDMFGNSGITLSTIVMTVLILIFGEITPKSIAKEIPEKFAMTSAPLLNLFIIILSPLNFFFTKFKKLISKVIDVKDDRSITEEEILTFVDEAQSEGGIDEHEGALIRSAIEFNDLDVSDVITPRVDIIGVELNSTSDEVLQILKDNGFSRTPVYDKVIDNVIGMIHEKDFYTRYQDSDFVIEDIVKPVVFVNKTMKISKLLRKLQQSKSHMAIVVDEYGGTAGIVTLEDILEELVGEIWDEHDEIVNEIVKLGEEKYKISGNANLDKVLELFDIKKQYESSTVSGWIVELLDKIPNESDSFTYENLKIIITKTDYRRVVEIVVAQAI
jgi:CBS domain containing-hemolysin-like protein